MTTEIRSSVKVLSTSGSQPSEIRALWRVAAAAGVEATEAKATNLFALHTFFGLVAFATLAVKTRASPSFRNRLIE
jgi:hypothetical protein